MKFGTGRYYFVIREEVSEYYNVRQYSTIFLEDINDNIRPIPIINKYIAMYPMSVRSYVMRLISISDYVIFTNGIETYYIKDKFANRHGVDSDEFTFIKLASVELNELALHLS